MALRNVHTRSGTLGIGSSKPPKLGTYNEGILNSGPGIWNPEVWLGLLWRTAAGNCNIITFYLYLSTGRGKMPFLTFY